MNKIIPITILLGILTICSAWDPTDMEIFDLYEEVNGTFYELLGISESATTTEVRRSYRKLSLQLHPDKNKAENAEEQFRQLVAIYEILKDKEKREKYDNVLKNGLPDWRQPIYYYRKYRKMGTLELSIIVSIIFTIGHYLTWLVAYYEKRFEMEEILDPIRKRMQKKKAKGKSLAPEEENLDTDDIIERELGYRKPGRWDLLPFVLYRSSIRSVKYIINTVKDMKREYKERKAREALEALEIEEEEEQPVTPKPKRVKTKIVLRDASEFEEESNGYVPGIHRDDGNDSEPEKIKKSKWTDEDFAALSKSMGKFPGGTPGRWERIAHELGRSPAEVIKTVKNLKSSLTSNVASSGGDKLQKNKREVNVSDGVLTKVIDVEIKNSFIVTDSIDYMNQEEVPDDYDEGTAPPEEPEFDYTIVNKKSKVKTRPVDENKSESNETKEEENTETNSTSHDVDVWSQVQQKCLEAAIKQFPKSTADRWTCIARAVPDKHKDQCVARFKILAELMKKRKETKS